MSSKMKILTEAFGRLKRIDHKTMFTEMKPRPTIVSGIVSESAIDNSSSKKRRKEDFDKRIIGDPIGKVISSVLELSGSVPAYSSLVLASTEKVSIQRVSKVIDRINVIKKMKKRR